MTNNSTEKYFDNLAQQYDYFKKKNWYYYQNVKKLYKQLIPEQSNVLEVGCGTGDLISFLNAQVAIGIDISSEMIRIARNKYPHIHFEATTIDRFQPDSKLQYIFFSDVIEHLEDIPGTMAALSKICNQDMYVIFSYANPLWNPILLLLEKLSLKMPEGPHYRIPYCKFKSIIQEFGFETIERGWRLIFPAYLAYASEFINNCYPMLGLKRFGLIEYVIIKLR